MTLLHEGYDLIVFNFHLKRNQDRRAVLCLNPRTPAADERRIALPVLLRPITVASLRGQKPCATKTTEVVDSENRTCYGCLNVILFTAKCQLFMLQTVSTE